MPDVRVVSGGQNNTPITAADVRALLRANAVVVVQVNASGDIVNPGGAGGSGGDGAINDGANSSIKATVKDYSNSKPLAVVLVNVSGDVYNSSGGGGAASNVNLNQVGGVATAVNAGNVDNGTQRVVLASDQPAVPVSASSPIPVKQSGGFATAITGDVLLRVGQPTLDVRQDGPVGAQIVGGGVGGTVGLSGDTQVGAVQRGAWAVGITGDPLLRVSQNGVVGVQVIGGAVGGKVGVSGDVNVTATDLDVRPLSPSQDSVRIYGGEIGVSGDVLLRSNTGVDIGNVGIKSNQEINTREQSKIGAHIAGGLVGVSGDVSVTGSDFDIRDLNPSKDSVRVHGGVAGITGDVSTVPKAGETWPVSFPGGVSTVPPVTGVNIIGGSVGGRVSISGDSIAVTATDLDTRNLNPGQDSIFVHSGKVGVTGDVSTAPKAGETWPVSISQTIQTAQQGTIGVQILGGQGSVGITGDASTKPKAGEVWPVSVMQGAGSGDTSLVDGVTRSVKATVRDYGNSNPLAVVLTNVSGDTYNASGGSSSGGDGAIVDGVDSGIKATVKDYANSNPLVVALANVSGDIYNAGGGSSGGDGAILDGSDTAIRARVYTGGAVRVSGDFSLSGSMDKNLFSVASNPAANINVTSSSTTILNANSNRRYAIIRNAGGSTIFFRLGSPAVTSDFPLHSGDAWEMPQHYIYTGIITGITSSGTQPVRVMEY